MKARFIGAPSLNLSGQVDGKDVTVAATLGEVIPISDEQKQLIEASGTHILVPPLHHGRERLDEWDSEKQEIRRSKVPGPVPVVQSDDWTLTPIPDAPPAIPPEQVARAAQAREARRVVWEAEAAAKAAKKEGEKP